MTPDKIGSLISKAKQGPISMDEQIALAELAEEYRGSALRLERSIHWLIKGEEEIEARMDKMIKLLEVSE